MGLYILFFWILFLSSLSLAPKNYFFPVCDQNLFCSEFWGKAFAVLSTCGDYRSIAFTSLHLLLNIGSIFFSYKEVIHFCNLFCPMWITSNMSVGDDFLTSGDRSKAKQTNTILSSLSEGLENSIWWFYFPCKALKE